MTIGKAIEKVETPVESSTNNSKFLVRKEKVKNVATKQLIGKSQVRYSNALVIKSLIISMNCLL